MAAWPVDERGRPLMRCQGYGTVGHDDDGHWWGAQLRNRHPVEGVRFLWCPARPLIAVGRSQ